MRKFLKLVCAAMAAVTATTFVACKSDTDSTSSGDGGKKTTLKIEYYAGGYGSVWLDTVIADFEKAYNCKVEASGQPRVANDLANHLKTGKKLQDIYFCQAGLDWSSYVRQGKLANLDEVYASEVEKLDGTKIKIRDYMTDYASSKYMLAKDVQSGESNYWAMPWGSITIGMAVNLDIMENTAHTTDKSGVWKKGDKWKIEEIEASFSNLKQYYAELDLDYNEGYAALGLNSNDIHWLQNAIYCWWAQYQGVYEENTANNVTNGSFYDFYNWESYDVLKQEGLIKALSMVRELIVDETKANSRGGAYKNIPTNMGEMDLQRLEINFMQGKYATMLAGSFFENETKIYNDKGTRYKLISMPNCDEAEIKDGKPVKVTYNTVNESVVVPAKAPNLELAKKFLAFMCNEKYLVDFSQKTGTLRPFDYDPVHLAPDYAWTEFQKDIVELNRSADYVITTYPVKAMQNNTKTPIATFYNLGLFGKSSSTDVFVNIKYLTAEEILVTGGKNAVNNINWQGAYESTKKDWSKMLSDLGLKENKF